MAVIAHPTPDDVAWATVTLAKTIGPLASDDYVARVGRVIEWLHAASHQRGAVDALLSDAAVEAARLAIIAGGGTRDAIRAAIDSAGLDVEVRHG